VIHQFPLPSHVPWSDVALQELLSNRLLIREAYTGGKGKEGFLDFAKRLVATKETNAKNTPTFTLANNQIIRGIAMEGFW